MRIPTVKVKENNEQGFIVINEDDFNSEHSLFEEVDKAESKKEKQKANKAERKKES